LASPTRKNTGKYTMAMEIPMQRTRVEGKVLFSGIKL